MAGFKGKAARRGSQTREEALSNQHSAVSRTKNKAKKPTISGLRKRRRTNVLRFPELAGKTVAFIEMNWSAEFPCVEVGFDDKTALLVLMGTRLTMEPAYSDWKTGNLRELRRWSRHETEGT